MTATARATTSDALIVAAAGAMGGALGVIGAETTPLVAVAVLAAVGVTILALLRPVAAIYVALLLIPLEATATARFGAFGVTPAELVIVAAAAGWIGRTLVQGGKLPTSGLVPPLLAVLAIHVPGLFLAADQFTVFKEMFMWGAMFVLLLAVLTDEDEQTTMRLAGVIAATGALVAAVAIVKSAGGTQIAFEGGGLVTNRAVGPFASPVHLGTFVVITVPLQLAFMLRGRSNLVRLGAGAAVMLSLSSLALALSRSAFVALLAAIACVIVYWRPARRAALVGALVLAVLLVTRFNPAPSLFNSEVIGKRIDSITSADTRSVQDRVRIWKKADEIFVDNLPFGIGAKNLPVRAAEYDLIFPSGTPSNAHNTFLVVATEFGLVGLIVFVWLVVALVRVVVGALRFSGEPEHSVAVALAATFLALVVDGVTGYSYGSNPFALVVFLLAALVARIELKARASHAVPEAIPTPKAPPGPPQPNPRPVLS